MNRHIANSMPGRHGQRGVALLIAMIILIGITLISLAGIQSSTMGLRMAANQEADTRTFQTAMAAIDFILSDESNLPATSDLLEEIAITLPSGTVFTVTSPDYITATALRVEECGLPPRARTGTSITAFSSFRYEAAADVDLLNSGGGRSTMAQGYTLLGPKC